MRIFPILGLGREKWMHHNGTTMKIKGMAYSFTLKNKGNWKQGYFQEDGIDQSRGLRGCGEKLSNYLKILA
jgi:hypothetical protein